MMRTATHARGRTHLAHGLMVVVVVLSCASVWAFQARANSSQRIATDISETRHLAQRLFMANSSIAFGAEADRVVLESDLDQLRSRRSVIEEAVPVAERGSIDGFLTRLTDQTEEAMNPGDAGRSGVGADFLTMLAGVSVDFEQFSAFDRALGSHSDRLLLEADQRAGLAKVGMIISTILSLAVVGLAWLLGEQSRRRELLVSTREASQRQFEALILDSPDIVVVLDGDKVRYLSPSASELWGKELPSSISDVVTVLPKERREIAADLIRTAPGGQKSLSQRVTDHEGNERVYEIRFSDLTDTADVGGRVMTCREVTTEVDLRAELEEKANVDDLTGLPSRRVLEPGLAQALGRARRGNGNVALLMIDLDGFKRTNDILGHQAGDMLLRSVGERLRTAQRSGELVVRLGGDEFAIVLEEIDGNDDARRAAERFRSALAEPIRIGDRTTAVRMSTGLVVASEDDDAASLLSRADIAMYEAKDQGRNRVVAFMPEMEAEAGRMAEVHRALTSADIERDFHLVYQPIFHTGEVGGPVSVEALLRWEPPGLGPIGPDVFIPLAEQSGDIVALGSWVLHTACRQLGRWRVEQQLDDLAVSVNVSAVQLMEADFVEDVLAALRESNLAGRHLIVEVTESLLADSGGMGAKRLEQLREHGIRVAMDDFGTGYSSLSQLLDLPFDILKVDRSLVSSLGQESPDLGSEAVMGSVVSLADALGIRVVAEGVESLAQLETLNATGIHLAQGYLLARPTSAENTVFDGGRSWLGSLDSVDRHGRTIDALGAAVKNI